MFQYIHVLKATCFAMSCLATGLLQAQSPPNFTLGVVPAAPVAFDLIVAKLASGNPCSIDQNSIRIAQTGALIRVDVDAKGDCVPTGGPFGLDVMLGRLPPGAYMLAVFQPASVQVASAQFVVGNKTTVAPRPLVDYTDWWWALQESGWGLSVIQHNSDRIFAAWFVYDQARQPVWYTLQPGQWTSFGTYVGPVYRTTGPYYGGPFDQSQVGITLVGTATLSFSDFANGTFSYAVDGVTGTKQISRLPF